MRTISCSSRSHLTPAPKDTYYLKKNTKGELEALSALTLHKEMEFLQKHSEFRKTHSLGKSLSSRIPSSWISSILTFQLTMALVSILVALVGTIMFYLPLTCPPIILMLSLASSLVLFSGILLGSFFWINQYSTRKNMQILLQSSWTKEFPRIIQKASQVEGSKKFELTANNNQEKNISLVPYSPSYSLEAHERFYLFIEDEEKNKENKKSAS